MNVLKEIAWAAIMVLTFTAFSALFLFWWLDA